MTEGDRTARAPSDRLSSLETWRELSDKRADEDRKVLKALNDLMISIAADMKGIRDLLAAGVARFDAQDKRISEQDLKIERLGSAHAQQTKEMMQEVRGEFVELRKDIEGFGEDVAALKVWRSNHRVVARIWTGLWTAGVAIVASGVGAWVGVRFTGH